MFGRRAYIFDRETNSLCGCSDGS
ncbi:hypothetical protein VARIO8X_20301 [Burkholderiales bacterium 8X]|nr:hypothetical protein VARIO8X_20301 [Burkholderiales bacterium 8X]